MSTLFMRRLTLCLIAGACALLLPGTGRADPVDKLRAALKVNVGGLEPNLQLAAKRNKMIEAAIPELKTIDQLRRAYFKLPWPVRIDKAPKAVDTDHYRDEIGKKLEQAIKAAAEDRSVDRQQAVAILIAQIAPKAEDKKKTDPIKEQYARRLTGVVLRLAREADVSTRQAALNALGKITPDPKEAFPALKAVLDKNELGPRRLAAFAVVDLVKNSDYLEFKEKLDTIEQAVVTASLGMRDVDPDVRGYCLQALDESARASADLFVTIDLTVQAKGKQTLRPDLQQALKTYQSANRPLLRGLHDGNLKVRLTAMQALDQIGMMRGKVLLALRDIDPEDTSKSGDVLKAFAAPDPLAEIVGDLGKVTLVLADDDVRVRRGGIDFLELLGDQADPAVKEISQALRDPDRFVRWSAARAIRNVTPDKIGDDAIRTLGTMVIDIDPEIGRAAADAIAAIGPAAHDAVDWLGFVAANGDTDSRNWDTETRVAAMKAIVSIGKAGQRSISKVLTALTDPDVRVRRQAAETLGRLGRPADAVLADHEVTALRRALRDDDAAVRLNASEAILNVAAAKKPL